MGLPVSMAPLQSKRPLNGTPDHVALFLEVRPWSPDLAGQYSNLTLAGISSFTLFHSSLRAFIPATPIPSGSAQAPCCLSPVPEPLLGMPFPYHATSLPC